MRGDFDTMISALLYRVKYKPKTNGTKDDLDEAEINYLYKRIVDKVVIRMFDDLIDNKNLQIGFRQLNRVERMVILFNVANDFSLQQTAELIGTSLGNVKTQKSTALKRLRQEIENA